MRVGVMFQHISNGGATDPNPGINALGFTVGLSWGF
jgi:lipid A 3-O-deacylase